MASAVIARNYLQADEDIKQLYKGPRVTFRRQKLLQTLLVTFLFIVLVGGLAILGIGIWTLEAEYGSKQLSKLIEADLYHVDSYLLIITGSAIIAISLLGCCGVCTRIKCMMGLHLGLLAFMSVMLFVAGILGYVLLSELEDKVRHKMEKVLVEEYGINMSPQYWPTTITAAWDEIQQNFECCGAYGDVNSTTSWALYKTSSLWFSGNYNNNSLVPESCCDPSGDVELCMGRKGSMGPPTQGPPMTLPLPVLNYTLYTDGCYDKLKTYLTYAGVVIGTCAIVVGVFMLVEMVLSILVYRSMLDN